MSRRKLAFVAAVSVTAFTAACGSTSNAGTGDAGAGGGGGATQAAVGTDQICGKGTGAKPGYTNDIATVAGGKSQLSGAGSTFVAPVMSVWTKDYSTATKVQVAYQSIGSGGGVSQISAQTIDFGASDTPLKDTELAAAKGGPILHIPLVLGAVVPTYKVAGQSTGLKFTGEVLGKIYTGQITKWDDPELTGLNPNAKLPGEPIAVVHRSDGSGTTAVWSDYLTKTSPSWVAKLGTGKSSGKDIAWPTGIGGKGNEGVSGVVGQTEGAIGYVELNYALAQSLPYGLVKNKAGKFIQPCIETVSAATEGATFPPDLRAGLTDEPGADAFPMTGTTFALVYQNQKDASTAAGVVNFLSWVLSTGQDDTAALNYSPLGKDLRALAVGQVKKITLNGAPVAK